MVEGQAGPPFNAQQFLMDVAEGRASAESIPRGAMALLAPPLPLTVQAASTPAPRKDAVPPAEESIPDEDTVAAEPAAKRARKRKGAK